MRMQRQKWKVWANILGNLVLILSLGFIISKVAKSELWSFREVAIAEIAALVAIGSVVYLCNLIVLSAAWGKWLSVFEGGEFNFRVCYRIYGVSQLAKYLPGNVFHFPGRHILGRKYGFSHAALIGATVYENVGMVMIASVLTLFGYILGIQISDSLWVIVAVNLFAVILLLTPVILSVLPERLIKKFHIEDLLRYSLKKRWRHIIPIVFYYLLFFLISGSILLVIYSTIAPVTDISVVAKVILINTIAWLVGMLTPGAPAGAGVREAMFVLTFSRYLGAANSLYVALVYRMVTFIGDLLFFLSARLISHGGVFDSEVE